MKKQANAWIGLVIPCFLLVTIIASITRDAFYLNWPISLLVGALALGLIMALIYPPILKKQMLTYVPEDKVPVAASPDGFPLLDRVQLEALCLELEVLGFAVLCDYSAHSDTAPQFPAFTRVMLHDDEHCIAVLNQQFFPAKTWPLSMSFVSFFGDGPQRVSFEIEPRAPLPSPGASAEQKKAFPEDFWLYSTHNQAPHRYSGLWNHPRILHRQMKGANTKEMLQQHLADREKIVARVQLPLVRDLSIEHYFTWNRWLNGVYRRQLERTNFYIALPRAFFENSNAWWGELGRLESP